ncbi:tumor necrosis factor receptor superfamily member 1A [Colossoma macropomum]|uniref:tumor necrosis factor receptor superfamily member 1A n=1 Tax=Colossoma macropomum TaxID=42526 RepID=UPI001863E6B2|nr:tumor necrosis factor receptor superfamily member 1A [Colossoma macropomum]
MDTGHNRSKWRRTCVPYLLFLLTLLRQTDASTEYKNGTGSNSIQTETCAENEYSYNGICCDKCPPGFKLKNVCAGKGLRSSCEKCGPEFYLDSTNYFRNCFSCSKCKKNEVEESPCTHKKNRVCACKPGYYRSSVNLNTWSCSRCKKCGAGERVSQACSRNNNTVCECKDFHYRLNKTTCVFCKGCSEKCRDLCTSPTPSVSPEPDPELPVVIIPILASTVFMILFIAYLRIRQWRKKKRNQSESPDPEKDTTEQTQVPTKIKDEESVPLANHSVEHEQDQALPDCVPREIRTHEFMYFVLEVVPVKRFKELVRRLNVSEQDIDRAERDNHAFADAQYQMLKIWSDNASGGGKNILPRPLLQEFVDRLKDMNLNGCAESIENKYSTEA